MSMDPILWAMKDAPIADLEEWAILVCLSERADDDGCSSFPSQETIAQRVKLSDRTVRRRLETMELRGLIGRGDQAAAAYLKSKAPVVWDLLIPLSWFPNVERIQEFRERRGRPPLSRTDRPDLLTPPSAPDPDYSPHDVQATRGSTRTIWTDSQSKTDGPPVPPSTPSRTTAKADKLDGLPVHPDNLDGLPVQIGRTPSPTKHKQQTLLEVQELFAAADASTSHPASPKEASTPPRGPHLPTNPLQAQAIELTRRWYDPLPIKPLSPKTFRNVLGIVATALRTGRDPETEILPALTACGVAVTQSALDYQFERQSRQRTTRPASESFHAGIDLARRIHDHEEAQARTENNHELGESA